MKKGKFPKRNPAAKPGNVTGKPAAKPTCSAGICEYEKVCAKIGGCYLELQKGKGKKR